MADGGQDTMQAERTRLTLVLNQRYLQVSRLLLLRRDPATGNGLKAGAASGADSAWGLMGFEAEAPESLGPGQATADWPPCQPHPGPTCTRPVSVRSGGFCLLRTTPWP